MEIIESEEQKQKKIEKKIPSIWPWISLNRFFKYTFFRVSSMTTTKRNCGASQVAQCYRICWPMLEPQETWVQSLRGEDPLKEEMATNPSILAWTIPWTEEPGGPQSLGSQRVGHDWVTKHACKLSSVLITGKTEKFTKLWKWNNVTLSKRSQRKLANT